MKIQIYNNQNYEEICSWWKKQQWPVIPQESLSTSGFLVVNDNVNVLAGWVYETNSNIALLEFVVANPEIKGPQRDEAFELLFKTVDSYCKLRNFKFIFTMVRNESLMKRLENNSFQKTDQNMTHYMRSL